MKLTKKEKGLMKTMSENAWVKMMTKKSLKKERAYNKPIKKRKR